MKVYLAKFTLGEQVAYKIGHTKHTYEPSKRFDYEQYTVFDNVEILEGIDVQHPSYYVAKQAAIDLEEEIKAVWPKNFYLEEHFNKPRGTFNGLSGITEMFILTDNITEKDVVSSFLTFKERYK